MSHEKTAAILMALAQKTSAGTLVWSSTEETAVFQTSFPNYSVRIFEAPSQFEDTTDFVLQIVNSTGDVVEEVRDTELTDYFEKPFVFMRDLYEGARRRAMGVDDAMDEILKTLGSP